MRKRIILGIMAAFLVATPGWGQDYVRNQTRSQLRDVGFSDSFISRLKRNSASQTDQAIISIPNTKIGRQISLESEPGTLPKGLPDAIPINSKTGFEIPSRALFPPTSQAIAPLTKSPGPIYSMDSRIAAKPPVSPNWSGKMISRPTSSAPIVQNGPSENFDRSQGVLPSPQNYVPSQDYSQEGSGEIYSQEPLNLPPITNIPRPSRVTLPPVSQQAVMALSLQDAVTRVLACNMVGLTGLNQTTVADISREGSFKMGFHTNWYYLERVYDRVLASGESGRFFEAPLFFNYAATDDLEFALMLPILDHTVKSRILWPKDFRESGLGDTKLSFKYRIFDNPHYQMRGAFGLGFKFPTGSSDKNLGTGKTDFEIFTAFSKNFERIIAHLHMGYVMTGDPNNQYYPNGLADIFYYNIGLEYPHANNVTVIAELNGQDQGSEGMKVDVTPSLRYTPTENFAFDVGVPISVTNDQRYGYNYRLTFGVTAFFR